MYVKYVHENVIEADVTQLLTEYGRTQTHVIEPPVPVEDILERQLGVQLGFEDLCAKHGSENVLGEIVFKRDSTEVLIDERLDPTVYPSMTGRYRFTLAHETGHFRLHRDQVSPDWSQVLLFDVRQEPRVVCRDGARERIEVQANLYAAELLMPRAMIFQVWSQRGHGNVGRGPSGAWQSEVVKDMAKFFEVSREAMGYRLGNLGLLGVAGTADMLLVGEP